ncbi:hypothetical protein PCE31106_02732 [Pandoraea cepalis]|uniref:Uncharacterized protein n=2 Tax=Pandoraea cepalis TaxID=2508294 RepID=A0A5E4VPN7_9BURK|nr:hypothetical protein PCE31106_02732 [Pandoraea cepalis]
MRMNNAGVLCLSETSTRGSVIVKDDGKIAYYPTRVNWTLASDPEGLSDSDLLTVLEASFHTPEPDALDALWKIVAEDECKAYFIEQYDRYNFPGDGYSDKIAESIRYALERYSIPQVWNLIYYTMKGLAALLQDSRYTRRHVYNMIPGNIRRRVDNSIANNYEVRPWGRQSEAKEAFLTSLFFDKILGGGTEDFNLVNSSNIGAVADRLGEIPF